jgi:hypothetical protein
VPPSPGAGPNVAKNFGTVQLLSFVAIAAPPESSPLMLKTCATQASNGDRYRLKSRTLRPL